MDSWNDKLSSFAKNGKMEFAGSMSTLVGAKGTIGGIPYNCLVRRCWGRQMFLNLYVPIGILGLAQAVLSCINWRPARFIAGAGEVGTLLQLCGLKASGNARYVGLQSSIVDLPVRSVVGESLVLELLRCVKEKDDREPYQVALRKKMDIESVSAVLDEGRNSGRTVWVIWARIKDEDMKLELHVDHDTFGVCDLFSIFAVIACVLAFGWMAFYKFWFGFALVIIGMILNACLTGCLRPLKFELPKSIPAGGAPVGDAVVQLMDEPDVFCVLQGPEKAIQVLLQKPVLLKAESVKQRSLFVVSVFLYIYSAFIWLVMPYMSTSVQLVWAIVVCWGAFADLCKGSFDCKRYIAKKIIDVCEIGEPDINVKKPDINKPAKNFRYMKFSNRTAAVASIVLDATTKEDNLKDMQGVKEAKLLPTTGPVWDKWWKVLEYVIKKENVQSNVDNLFESVANDPQLTDGDFMLLTNLTKDVRLGIESLYDYMEIPKWKSRKEFMDIRKSMEVENARKKSSSR